MNDNSQAIFPTTVEKTWVVIFFFVLKPYYLFLQYDLLHRLSKLKGFYMPKINVLLLSTICGQQLYVTILL